MKIRTQVYLISLSSSIIPLIFLAITSFFLFGNEFRKSEKEKVELILQQGETYLQNTFEDLNSKLTIFEDIYKGHDAEKLKEYMDIFSANTKEVEYFVFGDSEGHLYTGDTFPGKLPYDYDPRRRPWYIGAAMTQNDYFISEVFSHASTGKPVITISKRFEKNGEVVGVITALLNLEILGENLKRFRTNKVTDFLVLDKHGDPLFSVNKKVFLHLEHKDGGSNLGHGIKYLDGLEVKLDHSDETFLPLEFIEQNYNKLMAEGFLSHDNIDGREFYYSHPVKFANITLVGGSYEKELLKPVIKIQKIIFYISLGTLIFTTILILIFGYKFSASLTRLSYIIDNIARGDYSKNILNIDKFVNVNSELYLVKEGIKKMQKEIQEREKKLKLISEMDSLTQIYNKGAITDIINMEINRSKSFGTEFSLIMFDLDHFKNINDTYGHLFGDEVLRKISKKVLEKLKNTDAFGRYGGEEFLILLPDTDIHGGEVLAERLRKTIFSIEWSEHTTVSASFGLAHFINPDNFETTVAIVDSLLYRAKKNGRNQVAFNKSGKK